MEATLRAVLADERRRGRQTQLLHEISAEWKMTPGQVADAIGVPRSRYRCWFYGSEFMPNRWKDYLTICHVAAFHIDGAWFHERLEQYSGHRPKA
jgi:hypothetical protein